MAMCNTLNYSLRTIRHQHIDGTLLIHNMFMLLVIAIYGAIWCEFLVDQSESSYCETWCNIIMIISVILLIVSLMKWGKIEKMWEQFRSLQLEVLENERRKNERVESGARVWEWKTSENSLWKLLVVASFRFKALITSHASNLNRNYLNFLL